MTDEAEKKEVQLALCTADNVKQYVKAYVDLRDKIRSMDDAHKLRTEQHRDFLNALNTRLLEFLNTSGVDNVKVGDVGTFHKIHRKSASIMDGDAFRRHVIGTESWDLVDWKANSIAVEKFIEESSAPPPGVKFTVAVTTGVRKS